MTSVAIVFLRNVFSCEEFCFCLLYVFMMFRIVFFFSFNISVELQALERALRVYQQTHQLHISLACEKKKKTVSHPVIFILHIRTWNDKRNCTETLTFCLLDWNSYFFEFFFFFYFLTMKCVFQHTSSKVLLLYFFHFQIISLKYTRLWRFL